MGAGRGDGGCLRERPRPGRGRPEGHRRHHLPGAGGAFYAFPRVAELGLPAAELADRLLADAGVALLPAPPSAPTARATCACRYATAAERLREGLDRIERVAAVLQAPAHSERVAGEATSAGWTQKVRMLVNSDADRGQLTAIAAAQIPPNGSRGSRRPRR